MGYRESAQSWRELLADLKARGLAVPPELAIGDGALGFWKAIEEEFGATQQQRCWVHKTVNVLNRLPKSMQPKAKANLKEIWMAEGRADAEKAFDRFLAKYEAKYDKAAACPAKDREALLAFYDFPAGHWKHIRTSNPIESTFATVRHRTTRAKGCLSNETGVIMVFKMIQTAQSSWRRLDGQNQLPKLITGSNSPTASKPAAETPPDQFQPGRHQDLRITLMRGRSNDPHENSQGVISHCGSYRRQSKTECQRGWLCLNLSRRIRDQRRKRRPRC